MTDKIETKDQITTTEEAATVIAEQSPRVLTADEVELIAGGSGDGSSIGQLNVE